MVSVLLDRVGFNERGRVFEKRGSDDCQIVGRRLRLGSVSGWDILGLGRLAIEIASGPRGKSGRKLTDASDIIRQCGF